MTFNNTINIIGVNPEEAAEIIRIWLYENKNYTGCEKAAVLMSSVNLEIVNKIFNYLRKDEIKNISLKVEQLKKINGGKFNSKLQKLIYLKKTNSVLREFNEKLKARLSGNKDGAVYATKILGTGKI